MDSTTFLIKDQKIMITKLSQWMFAGSLLLVVVTLSYCMNISFDSKTVVPYLRALKCL
jgi:hypothetical protein